MHIVDERPVYRIVVEGNLHMRWSDWFSGMRIEHQNAQKDNPVTILQGPISDQSALRGMLIKLWDLNLILIAVQRIDEDQCKEKQYE